MHFFSITDRIANSSTLEVPLENETAYRGHPQKLRATKVITSKPLKRSPT